MKRVQPICFLFVAALLVMTTACYKDKGNYSYSDTNKLTIVMDTITVNSTINVNQADTLRLTPTIRQSFGKEEGPFAFEWKIFDNSPSTLLSAPRKVIATTRNLVIPVTEPNFTLGQRYRMAYTVTDTVTGISTFFTFNMQVVNRFASGWVVLQDLPNGGDYSMILNGDLLEHHVFAQTNPGLAMGSGTPVRLDISAPSVDDGITTPGTRRMYICHPNAGMELDYTTLKKRYNLQTLFFSPPAIMKPQSISWWTYPNQTATASFGTLVNDGKVYIAEIGGYPGAKKFGSALAMANNSNDYYAAPEAFNGLAYPIIFDTKNRRFHIVRPTKLDNFPDTVSTVANLNNLGMDLVYMDESNITRAYNVILKDGAGQRHLLRITFSATDYVLTSFIQPMNTPDINHATAFASTTGSPHIFYGVGNLLYRNEITSNTTTQPFSFPAGENIVSIRCRAGVEMLIATWDGSKGKVYKFGITNTGAISGGNYSKAYSGFGKIIDMKYKN
jgi:hypothetical protein